MATQRKGQLTRKWLGKLAQTDEDRRIVDALAERTKSGSERAGTCRISVGGHQVTVGPAADAEDFTGWPSSFRAFVKELGALRLDDDALVIGEDADGGLDSLASLLDKTELAGKAAEVHCPVEQRPNWWIYHPLDKAPSGEPRIHLLDHGGPSFQKGEGFDHIGSLALHLLADMIGIEAADTAAPGPDIAVKLIATLHKPVNKARAFGNHLFTAERPLKKELWEHYPDASSRIAVYELSKTPTLVGVLGLDAVPADLLIVDGHALILAVDWKARRFVLLEADVTDPRGMKLLGQVHEAKIPDNRDLGDAEQESRLFRESDGRVLARFNFNHRDMKNLVVLEHAAGAWKVVSEHAFDWVDPEKPFADLPSIASAQALVGLFDPHWGRVALVGEHAVVMLDSPPTVLQACDRNGKKGPKLKLSADGLSMRQVAVAGCDVVASSRGLDVRSRCARRRALDRQDRQTSFLQGAACLRFDGDRDRPLRQVRPRRRGRETEARAWLGEVKA